MVQVSLKDIFSNYVSRNPIFKNKDILSIKFTPDNIPHRNEQINQLAHILAPALRNEKPSNVFIYGKTGVGKTLVTEKV
ncbi:MAG: cell division control protein Cdc6, partial [Candidatus Aenigmatarchaeota archaeon]